MHQNDGIAADGSEGNACGARPAESRRRHHSSTTVVLKALECAEGLQTVNMPLPVFHEIAELIAWHFGIMVGENKRTLVTGRMHRMLENHGFATHRECLDAIKRDTSGRLLSELADRVSTNHTAFFRENPHFTLLTDLVLPDLTTRLQAGGNLDLRVWSAACATGEEAYSILFTLMKFFGPRYKSWRAGLLATDISAEALAAARHGVYSTQHLQSVPADVLSSCFTRVDEGNFQVRPELRKEITFRRLNLINDTFPLKKRFDLIFCRNVMIYFTPDIRVRLFEKLHAWLAPGGYLFIGHSESIMGMVDGFEYVAPACYRRR